MDNSIAPFLHAMPEVAQEEIARAQMNSVNVGNGVTRLEISGQDRGIAYRFDKIAVYNPIKSEEAGYEVFDEQEVCFRYVDRKNIIPMPVKNCPQEFLRFNRQGDLVGGRYAAAYKAWKNGEQAPGTALRKWDVLNTAEIASLEADGIFTIEQYAEYPEAKLVGRYPDQFIEGRRRAVQWVAGKEMREKAHEQAQKNAELIAQNKDLSERLAKLEAALGSPKESVAAPSSVVREKKSKLLED